MSPSVPLWGDEGWCGALAESDLISERFNLLYNSGYGYGYRDYRIHFIRVEEKTFTLKKFVGQMTNSKSSYDELEEGGYVAFKACGISTDGSVDKPHLLIISRHHWKISTGKMIIK